MNFVLDWLLPVILAALLVLLILGGVKCTMTVDSRPAVQQRQMTPEELEQQRQDLLDIAIYSVPMTMFTCPMP